LDAHHLQELIDLEEGYWWHVAKRRWAGQLLQRYLPVPGLVIEGGIGSGRNLLEFQRLGYEVAGLEIMPESVMHAHQAGVPNVQLHDLAESWPIPAGAARAVVMLDVLEHIADPIRALQHAAAVLRDDGGLVLTVPAYPSLYSDWDRKLGHYLRYTRKELLRQTAEAGLAPVWDGCWNALSLPAAIVSRRLTQRRSNGNGAEFPRLPALLNRLLIGCAAAERILSRWIRIPVGLSLVGVFVKQQGANPGARNELASC
jgi:SAM-dependent methyltransferase